jgi:antitoxin StbD
MTFLIHADVAASITELKKDPMGTINAGFGNTVAILNRNEPAFYAVPPRLYEALLELADDAELAALVRKRIESNEPTIAARIDLAGNLTFDDAIHA